MNQFDEKNAPELAETHIFEEFAAGTDSAKEQDADRRAHEAVILGPALEGTVEEQAQKPVAANVSPPAEQPDAKQVETPPFDPVEAADRLHTREEADAAVLQASRRHTRRAFLAAAAASGVGAGFYAWLDREPQRNMQPGLLRRAFDLNSAIFDAGNNTPLAPTYPLSRAENLRINGVVGLAKPLVPQSWRLQVVGVRAAEKSPRYTHDVTAWEYRYDDADAAEDKGHNTKTAPGGNPPPPQDRSGEDDNGTGRPQRGLAEAGESDSTLPKGTPGLLLTMDDITKLPRHELVTQFKCIEGWSQVVHWAGVRMADFLDAYPPAPVNGKPPRYVYMETPDGDYYTGYDMAVCRHPQTLLVTEMMGAPLTANHGAPLRLHMPIKYGYKQIKRIGLIAYTDDKPDDYWTKLGYDWYAGL